MLCQRVAQPAPRGVAHLAPRATAVRKRALAPLAAVQQETEEAVIEREVEAVLSLLPASVRRVAAKDYEEPIERLKQLGEKLNLNRVIPERLEGCIRGRLTTDQREFEGHQTSLGRASFAQFGPQDLRIDLGPDAVDAKLEEIGVPGFYRGPFEGTPHGYILFTLFKIVDERAGPGAPLYGIVNVIAEYSTPDTKEPGAAANVCGVQFKKLRLLPTPDVAADPHQFQRWMSLMKPANPGMDDSGCKEVELAKMPKGTLTYFMCGTKYQLQQGNLGSYTILEMYTPEPGSKKAEYVKQFATSTGRVKL